MIVEEVLAVVAHHPLGQNRASPANDARDSLSRQGDMLHQKACMDGHVIHALFGLLFDHLEHQPRRDILNPVYPGHGFIDGDRAHRHRRIPDDGAANRLQVSARGQVHHGVGAVLDRVAQLLEFLFDIRRNRRIADVGVDLTIGGDADTDRFQIGMPDVRRDDHAAARHLGADQLRREALPPGDAQHLLGGDALPGVVQLRSHTIIETLGDPFGSHRSSFSPPSDTPIMA